MYFYIALFLGILTLRMETTFFRFISDEKTKNKIYPLLSQIVLIACIVFIVMAIIFIEPIQSFLKYPDLKNHIFLTVSIIVLDVLSSLPFSKIRFKKQAMRYAYIKLSGIFLNIFLIFFFLEILKLIWPMFQFETLPASSKLFYILLANVLSSGFTLILLSPEIKESFQKVDWSFSRNILSYSWPLIIVTLCYTIMQNGYTSFLKFLLPGTPMENLQMSSQFNASARLAVIMNLFITSFNYAVEPFFFRHAKHEHAKEIYAKVSLYYICCCCLIYLFTCLFIKDFSLLLGSEYREALHLVSIFLLANIFAGLYSNLSSWYKLKDQTKMAAWISLSGLFLTLLINILLIPTYGMDVSAYAMLISYAAICVFSYLQGQRFFPIPYPLIKMGTYLVSSVLLVYGLRYLYDMFSVSYIAIFSINIFTIIIFCWVIFKCEFQKKNIFS